MRAGATGTFPTSSSRRNGATVSRGAPASRRWRPCCALRSTDGRSARRRPPRAVGVRRLVIVVLFCVAVILVALVVLYPDAFHDANEIARANAALDLIDRDIGGGKLGLPRPATARRSARPDRTGRDVCGRRGRSPARLDRAHGRRRQSRSSGTSSCHDDWIRTRDGSSASPATAARIPGASPSGRARTASRSSGERREVWAQFSGSAALNGAYAALGITVLWAIRGLARWTDVLRLAGLAYLLGVAAVRHPVDAAPRLRRPILRLGRRALAHWRHHGGGGCRRPFRPPAPAGLRRPEQARLLRCRARHGGEESRSPVSCSRRSSALRGYRACRRTTPGRSGSRRRRRSTSSVASTRRSSRPSPDRRTRRSSRSSTRRRSHAMGGVDVVTLHLQYWFLVVGAVAADRGLLYRTRAGMAALAVRSCSSSSCRALRRATAGPSGGHARRLPVRRRCAPARALVPRRARAGVSPRSPCCSPVRG